MPIIEIAVLIEVGSWLGLWPTLALIILTATVGTWMLRQQGFAVLSRAQGQFERGGIPLAEMFEGLCLVIAGALLLTPGFVTDAIGGALLLPPVRFWLYRIFGHVLRDNIHMSQTEVHRGPPGSGPRGGRGSEGPIVEGDYESMTPDDQGRSDSGDNPESVDRDIPDRDGDDEPMPPPRGSWTKRQ